MKNVIHTKTTIIIEKNGNTCLIIKNYCEVQQVIILLRNPTSDISDLQQLSQKSLKKFNKIKAAAFSLKKVKFYVKV